MTSNPQPLFYFVIVVLGASFIFYNCARIATLLKEFKNRVQKNIYPELPKLTDVDFSNLIQPVSTFNFLYAIRKNILSNWCHKIDITLSDNKKVQNLSMQEFIFIV